MADFKTLRDKIFEALSDYGYELREDDDKTRELVDTIARLTVQKAELEEKVKELTQVIEKQIACCPPEPKKEILHG